MNSDPLFRFAIHRFRLNRKSHGKLKLNVRLENGNSFWQSFFIFKWNFIHKNSFETQSMNGFLVENENEIHFLQKVAIEWMSVGVVAILRSITCSPRNRLMNFSMNVFAFIDTKAREISRKTNVCQTIRAHWRHHHRQAEKESNEKKQFRCSHTGRA